MTYSSVGRREFRRRRGVRQRLRASQRRLKVVVRGDGLVELLLGMRLRVVLIPRLVIPLMVLGLLRLLHLHCAAAFAAAFAAAAASAASSSRARRPDLSRTHPVSPAPNERSERLDKTERSGRFFACGTRGPRGSSSAARARVPRTAASTIDRSTRYRAGLRPTGSRASHPRPTPRARRPYPASCA